MTLAKDEDGLARLRTDATEPVRLMVGTPGPVPARPDAVAAAVADAERLAAAVREAVSEPARPAR